MYTLDQFNQDYGTQGWNPYGPTLPPVPGANVTSVTANPVDQMGREVNRDLEPPDPRLPFDPRNPEPRQPGNPIPRNPDELPPDGSTLPPPPWEGNNYDDWDPQYIGAEINDDTPVNTIPGGPSFIGPPDVWTAPNPEAPPPGYSGPQPQEHTNQGNPGYRPGDPNYTGPGTDLGPGYDQPMPDVDPYDVSDSPVVGDVTEIGGVSAVDPQAEPFAYDEVQQFADAAFDNAMRTLQPQMDDENERFAQELINKGIDPSSEAGQEAFDRLKRSQNDRLNAATFEALGFGAGIQNQMFGQDATRAGLASNLLQSQWGLTQRGHEFDTTANFQANDQAFGQMMGLEGLNYRDYLTNVDQQRYQDSLIMALMGLSGAPGYSTINTGLPQAGNTGYQGRLLNYNQAADFLNS